MSKGLLIISAIIVALALWVVGHYNSLVELEENVDNAFAKIETQYQRRLDLIPNLVSTVQGSASFQQETFTAVTEARSAWAKAGTPNAKVTAANAFEGALSRLLLTVENYPDLDTEAFKGLMVELEGTENRIGFARNEYNDIATAYNKSVRKIPRSFIAQLFDFDSDKALFEAKEGAEDAVEVNFDFGTDAITPTPVPAVVE